MPAMLKSCCSCCFSSIKHLRIAVSIPSANTSTFSNSSVSKSSLSHWITVLSAMAAFSTGTSSYKGPCEITKPPTCCDKCRGAPRSCSTRLISCCVVWLLLLSPSVLSCCCQLSAGSRRWMFFTKKSSWLIGNPNALPTSRSALLKR